MSGLTFKDRRSFQYKSATNLTSVIMGFFNLIDTLAAGDLLDYFDIDAAEGAWLTQVALTFNVLRSYTIIGSQFVLDVNNLDDENYILDGNYTPISDDVLRKLLKAKLLRNSSTIKSVEYIYTMINNVFSPESVSILDGDKELTISVNFDAGSESSAVNHLMLLAVLGVDQKWFGCPSGVSVTWDITIT